MKVEFGIDPVTVGRVRRPHGVRGEVLVEPLTDVSGRFAPGAVLALVDPSGKRRSVVLATVRAHREQLLVRFEGVEDRDGAAEFRGADLTVEPEQVPDAPSGTYYYFQLVGCTCRDKEAGDLGVVTEVVEDGGGLLLSLDLGGRTLLAPFVNEYVIDIDLERRMIDLELPPGLLELCVSPS